ncbi:MAG: phage integrase SAM-like domain-containing protein [Daejeonella sp.]
MVQLRVVLDARTQKTDGTSTIYYRITDKRKVTYISTGLSLEPRYWDESRGMVKKAYANAVTFNTSLSKRFMEVQKAIIELEDEGLFSIDSLKEKLNPKIEKQSFRSFTEMVIAEMFGRNQTGNALIYQTALNSLSQYKPSKGLMFTDITATLIESYEEHLLRKGCKINTISNYLRTIRAIYNKAIKAKVVDRRYYPFLEKSIRTERTAKRAFTKDVIKKIERLELTNKRMADARDYYILSFYLIGMNFTDMAYLTRNNIVDGRIEYRRRKTGTDYSIKILDPVRDRFDDYCSQPRKYLLPILPDNIIEGSLEGKKLIHQFIKTTNKYLKRISTQLELSKPCTTYTVRHSWGTIAKRMGYSKELISEALGHQQGNQITETYLDSFDRDVIDDVNSKVTS